MITGFYRSPGIADIETKRGYGYRFNAPVLRFTDEVAKGETLVRPEAIESYGEHGKKLRDWTSDFLDDPITRLLCFGEYQAHTHLAAAVCCLANKEAKRSSTLCPSWSRSCT